MAFDLHVHSFFSADAVGSPEELVAAAKRAGLHGIAITDHDSCRAVEYCRERGLAREDGTAVDGFLIIPGVEVSTAHGHMVCLGTTLPNLKGKPAPEVFAEIQARGGVPIPVHPWDRWRAGIRQNILDAMPVEVIEVFNAACTRRHYNDSAATYAETRGLCMTASSDAHHASAVGTARTLLDLTELTVDSVLAALRTATQVERKYLSRREGMKKHFGNWFRAFNRQPPPA